MPRNVWWARRGFPPRWISGFFRTLGFSRKGPVVLLKRGRLNLGCASMLLLVMFVSFLLVVDIVRLNSGQVDLALYQVALGLDNTAVVDVVAARRRFASVLAQGPVEGETYCQFRQRVGKLAVYYNAGDSLADYEPEPHTFSSIQATDSAPDATCVFPKLDPCDPQILLFDQSVPKVNCSVETNWVYVKNGTFHIRDEAIKRHGKILCEYAPIVRGRGDYTAVHAPHIKPMLDGSPLLTDFFKAACISQSGHRYFNIHLGVAFNPDLHKRGQTTPLPAKAMGGYDIFMFGFDSVSRMSWLRNLPKSREFFLRELGGIELEGHNIVGDGTVQALLPLLAGQTEQDLPTARRDAEGPVEVDNFPWIWRDFQKAGYVTAWGEDLSYIGTFQLRLKGFKEQPVDHSMRTYFLSAEPMYHRFLNGCTGSEVRHIRFFNYFRDMYHIYGNKRKFMFGFHSENSHSDNSKLKALDADFADFLKDLKTSGYLNHTILILMADHGARFSAIRQTQQGKLEERLPYFSFYFPPGFKAKYPKEVEQLRQNGKRLTTMFDIHETFHDILDNDPHRPSRTKGRGISLFKPIPSTRTCSQAGIEPHWCACLNWADASKNEALKLSTGTAVVDHLNSLTSIARDRCEKLSLSRVWNLSRFVPKKDLLMFKQSADAHGDIPDLTDNMTLNFEYMQVDLETTPGGGRFETTLKHSLDNGHFVVQSNGISRTNVYGNASACVSESLPSLRPYCYCKEKRSRFGIWR